MRSLKAHFLSTKESRPELSSYMHFAGAIKNKGFNGMTIARWFNKLVDKEDYEIEHKKEIIEYLTNLSKHAEECQKEPLFTSIKPLYI